MQIKMLDSVFIGEELEVLQSIYMDDLNVNIQKGFAELEITIHPSTADNDDEKYVCLTLLFKINDKYPSAIPDISFKGPRGLSEPHLASISENLKSLAKSRVDDFMIFELIEYTKDSLTDNNFPSCICPICLDHFIVDDLFFRSKCYHYFHMYCIQSYLKTSLTVDNNAESPTCPVCRAHMPHDIDLERNYKKNESTNTQMVNFEPSKEYTKWLTDCKVMFDKQKRNGGIIDVEKEKSHFHISSSSNSLSSYDENNSTIVNEEVTAKSNDDDETNNTKQFQSGNPKFTVNNPKFTSGNPKFTNGNSKFTVDNPKFTTGNPKFTTGNKSQNRGYAAKYHRQNQNCSNFYPQNEKYKISSTANGDSSQKSPNISRDKRKTTELTTCKDFYHRDTESRDMQKSSYYRDKKHSDRHRDGGASNHQIDTKSSSCQKSPNFSRGERNTTETTTRKDFYHRDTDSQDMQKSSNYHRDKKHSDHHRDARPSSHQGDKKSSSYQKSKGFSDYNRDKKHFRNGDKKYYKKEIPSTKKKDHRDTERPPLSNKRAEGDHKGDMKKSDQVSRTDVSKFT